MKGLFLVFAVASLNSFSAETTPATNTANVLRTPTAVDSKILLGVEVRPTYSGSSEQYRTDNNVMGGYQFNKDAYVFYRQDFTTNLYNPIETNNDGMNLTAIDGSFRGGINNIWNSGNLALNYEGRAYIPTSERSQDAGMVTQLRNYAHFKYSVRENLALIVSESPTFHVYNRAGTGTSAVNPWFENRTYLSAEWNILSDLKLRFPLKYSAMNYRTYLTAAQSGSWAHKLWLNPELFYRVNPNITLGLAFESASFVQTDFGGFSLGNGFENGLGQVILAASL